MRLQEVASSAVRVLSLSGPIVARLLVMRLLAPDTLWPQSATRTADTSHARIVATQPRGPNGETTTRALVGYAVGRIDSAAIGAPAARTMSDALIARVPGLSVMQSTGTVGLGARIRLRGPRGLSRPVLPRYRVDGIWMLDDPQPLALPIGGQAPSFLDDLEAQDLAQVQILPGAASASRFGANVGGGILSIATPDGLRGPMRWRVFAEGSSASEAVAYPANVGTDQGTAGAASCTRARAALSQCIAGAIVRWSPLEQASPFRTARGMHAGASVSGGSARSTYYLSAVGHDEEGVQPNNERRRIGARLNLGWSPLSALETHLHSWILDSRSQLPFGDNSIFGIRNAGLDGSPISDAAQHGFRPPYTSHQLNQVGDRQDARRTMIAASVRWAPTGWLTVDAQAGNDRSLRDEFESSAPLSPPSMFVSTTTADLDHRLTTLGGSATASYALFGGLRSATTVGVTRVDARSEVSTLTVNGNVSGSSGSGSKSRVDGVYAAEHLAWTDARQIGASVRRDRQSLFGAGLDPKTYLAFDASWAVGDEPFFPRSPILRGLRLRAAYGEAGDARSLLSVLPRLTVVPIGTSMMVEAPTELTREIEAGVDTDLLGSRLQLDATAFRSTVVHSPIVVPIPSGSALGFASWRTSGAEVSLGLDLVRMHEVQWSIGSTLAWFRSELRDLGGALPQIGSLTRNQPGEPLLAYWARPLRYADTNGDGVIVPGEVSLADSSVRIGSGVPTREISATSTLRLGRLTLRALADHRGGFRVYNSTARIRCGDNLCEPLYDPRASLAAQAAAVASLTAVAPYLEDGSFMRLREAAVSWQAPTTLARRLGASSVSFTLSGRNLALWTDYTGFDPEVSYLGEMTLTSYDLFTAPLPRTFALRIDIGR